MSKKALQGYVETELGIPWGSLEKHLTLGVQFSHNRWGANVMDDAKAPGPNGKARAREFGYVYTCGKGVNGVPLPSPAKLPNQSWAEWPLFEAGLQWAYACREGVPPFTPDESVYHIAEWPRKIMPRVLSVDTEGTNEIVRVSFAGRYEEKVWAATLPWEAPTLALLRDLIEAADYVVMWQAKHDQRLFLDSGIDINKDKILDGMIAHGMLNPWSRLGIGYAAPLYGMFRPWKHLWKLDPEEYSLRDSANMAMMFETMHEQLLDRRMWKAFLREMNLYWRYSFDTTPTWDSDWNIVTKAAGLMEMRR